MNRFIIGSMAAVLSLGAVACGSSAKPTAPNAAPTTTAPSSAGGTALSTPEPAAPVGIPIGTKQKAVLAKTEAELKAAGATYDVACLTTLIAQLTDADADLIVSVSPPATVTASPAGEAIGKQIPSCFTTSDAPATT